MIELWRHYWTIDTLRAARTTLIVSLLLVLGSISQGCTSVQTRRMQKDGMVIAASPVQIPAGAGRDTYNLLRRHPLAIPGFPFISVHYLYKHTIFSSSHLVDLVVVPTLASTSDTDNIGLYDVSRFPFSLREGFNEANVMKNTYKYTAISVVLAAYVYGGVHYVSEFGWFSADTIYYSLIPYIAPAGVWWTDEARSGSD